MCLAVPGRVISSIKNESDLKKAKVDFGGVIREVCIEWIPDVKIGDYVLVHVGYALNIVDENEAEEMLRTIKKIEDTENEIY